MCADLAWEQDASIAFKDQELERRALRSSQGERLLKALQTLRAQLRRARRLRARTTGVREAQAEQKKCFIHRGSLMT